MQLPTQSERASVRKSVTAAGVWRSSANESHETQRAAALLVGSQMPAYRVHRHAAKSDSASLYKCLLFSCRSRVDSTISFDDAHWYSSAARPPSICCSVCFGILFRCRDNTNWWTNIRLTCHLSRRKSNSCWNNCTKLWVENPAGLQRRLKRGKQCKRALNLLWTHVIRSCFFLSASPNLSTQAGRGQKRKEMRKKLVDQWWVDELQRDNLPRYLG